MTAPALGRYGAYLSATDYHNVFPRGRVQVLEDLGFGTVWIAGNAPGDLEIPESVLAQTKSAAVGTAIVNVWAEPPGKLAESFHRVEEEYPGRLILGIGIGHRELVGGTYQKPYAMLSDYLEQLRLLDVPADRIILAALRTKVLRLAAHRAAGALPFFTTVEHTKNARETLGKEPTLAVVQSFVTADDRGTNRSIVRDWAATYLKFTNYVNNLRENGFPELQPGGQPSEALLDALVPLGGAVETAMRIDEHLAAGANHVPVYPIPGPGDPIDAFRALAAQLPGDDREN